MEQITQTLAQAYQALMTLGVDTQYNIDYKIIDSTVMQTFSLVINGKEVFSKSVPLQETPEEFKQKTLEAKAKVEADHQEYIAKADEILAAIDASTEEVSSATKQTTDTPVEENSSNTVSNS